MKVRPRLQLFGMGLIAACLLTWLGLGEAVAATSINSTSKNKTSATTTPVTEQPKSANANYRVLVNNDLGMHCGDLDHRVASILPPFNVLHAQVIKKGAQPQILTDAAAQLFYSAASNPNDPALLLAPKSSIFKTNFWDPNPRTTNSLGFDGYDPFYPPGILSAFPLLPDTGLPVPDVERLYLGDGVLAADQQKMPGAGSPYAANAPQPFKRFNKSLPFFINFPFGYTVTDINWFSAEGIPVAPFDDFGRANPFPLVRVQAKDKTGSLTGTKGAVIASVDTVIPVSAEANCNKCHTSAQDGGSGKAACIPGVDLNCTAQGSPWSGKLFTVAVAANDTSLLPIDAKKEWAADNNIIRLHDAKHGTKLKSATPVVCQQCHYTPALDLAHVGPKGPDDADANGRNQKTHHSNSRALHRFHSGLTGLFATMPAATDTRRLNPVTGKPVVNAFVQTTLNNSCYQCHPGKNTKCLRGAMFNGGLICQDCHGNLAQVGDDFSLGFSAAKPFPAGMTAGKRIPWANEPGCQSCHTGDVLTNLTADPNVIKAKDGIRLLRAYRSNDTTAKPIVATNRRFAENATATGQQMLYRVSKDSHAGLYCEACHGSTHAEWPSKPESGTSIANDNMTAIQLQGHTGVVTECTTCHTGTMANSLSGPHGLHPVGVQSWIGGHENVAERNLNACRACHGKTGQGTVLAKVRANRTFSVEGRTVTLAKGALLGCNVCHENKL